jgi:hypothetical protein
MPYQVRLFLLVVGDTGSCYVTQHLELPFAPYPGLRLMFGNEEGWEELAEVTWDVASQRFVATLQPWDDGPFPFVEQLDLLRTQGWQVYESNSHPQA